MLIEDFFGETSYFIPAMKVNNESFWTFLTDLYPFFLEKGLIDEYYKIQGLNYIYSTLVSDLENHKNEYQKKITEIYNNGLVKY